MDKETEKSIIENSAADALLEVISHHTVCITSVRKDHQHGTGVAICVLGKYFIITAGHVIKNEDPTSLRFLGRSETPLVNVAKEEIGDTIEKCKFPTHPVALPIARHFISDSGADIGILEIDPNVPTEKTFQFHKIKDINQKVPKEGAVVLFGFPGELAQWVKHRETGKVGNLVVPWAEFTQISKPSNNISSSFDERIHFLLDYPVSTGEFGVNPHGMSGGGVWSYKKIGKSGEIWAPSISLIGIEHTWDKLRKLLKATRIEWILEMITAKMV